MVYQIQAKTIGRYNINSKLSTKYKANEDYFLKFKPERVLTSFRDQ